MKEEEQRIRKRLMELANRSYHSNRYEFTNFLNEMEQDIVLQLEREFPIAVSLYGIFPMSERNIAVFGNEDTFGYEEQPPVCLLKLTPVSKKYAEQLTHRDCLGALMHLGMEREMIGDILITPSAIYLACMQQMAEYIKTELTKIRHTIVTVSYCEETEVEDLRLAEGEEAELLVSSLRLDALVAAVFHISREESQRIIREKRVFVSGRLCENNSGIVKEDSMISVRKKGRFYFHNIAAKTKKDKFKIRITRYDS